MGLVPVRMPVAVVAVLAQCRAGRQCARACSHILVAWCWSVHALQHVLAFRVRADGSYSQRARCQLHGVARH